MSRISLLPEKISDFSAFLGSGDLIFKNPFHLICFYLVPELIVLKIHIRSKISVGLTVFQHVRCGESDRAVADIVVFDKGSGCFVRGGIGDVLKILEGDFRAAEEIQKFQGIFFVPFILLLPQLIGLLGVQLAQPAADLCTFAVTLPFLLSFLRRLKLWEQAERAVAEK